ncbi:MAG: DNA mismatch repair protein [Halanaeroarchaeum sp.]
MSTGTPISSNKRRTLNRLRKWQERARTGEPKERGKKAILSEVQRLVAALGLSKSDHEIAAAICHRASDQDLVPGPSYESIAAGVVYAAIRQAGHPQTLADLTNVSRLTEKQRLARAYRYLVRELDLQIPPPDPHDYLPKIASGLDLSQQTQRLAYDVVTATVDAGLHSGKDAGVTSGIFSPLAEIEPDALRDAAAALEHLDGETVRDGADQTLDQHRQRLAAVEQLHGTEAELLEEIQAGGGVRDADQLREAMIQYLARETAVGRDTVRQATPDEATDAPGFIGDTLRALTTHLQEAIEEREATVATDLRDTIEAARPAIDAATDAVDHLTLYVSLARFARAFDLTRPTLVDRASIGVEQARNLSLAAAEETAVQPVSYGIGDHDLDAPPAGDRAAVLTGANSGGKTTLLDTLCQVALLAQMGLPVPADAAEVGILDEVVFHRRHASFNAGVLETTLQSIVPPISNPGRTLMLVDEFEAITEPGSAADLLHGLVTLTVEHSAIGVFVTHLADDLQPLPETARIDGIVADGLDDTLELSVDYQPRFGELGRSTPEFIVSRLVANADDRRERASFETLVEELGGEVRQRTLGEVETSEGVDSGTNAE